MYKNFYTSSAKYYQENKGRLQRKALERYQNLSKKAKVEKATIWSWTYQNLSEDKKYKLVEYRKSTME